MRLTTALLVCGLLASLATRAESGTYRAGPLPSEFGGDIIAPDPDAFKNVQAARQAVSKLRLAVEKCYAKGVSNYVKGKPTGIALCLDDPAKGALARYAATIQKLQAKPGSLSVCAGFVAKGAQVAEQMRALHAFDYCGDPPVFGSPGGAFVDGPGSF